MCLPPTYPLPVSFASRPQDSHSLYMVMELVQGGEFFTYLQAGSVRNPACTDLCPHACLHRLLHLPLLTKDGACLHACSHAHRPDQPALLHWL